MRINDFPWKSYAFPWKIIDPNISYLLRVFKVLRTPDNSGKGGGPPDNSGNGWPPKTVDEKLEKLQSVEVFRVWRPLPHFTIPGTWYPGRSKR